MNLKVDYRNKLTTYLTGQHMFLICIRRTKESVYFL